MVQSLIFMILSLVFPQDTCLTQGTLSKCLYLRQFFNISFFSFIKYVALEFIYHMLSELCTENMIIDILLDFMGFIARIAMTYQTLINLSSQQSLYFPGYIHLILSLNFLSSLIISALPFSFPSIFALVLLHTSSLLLWLSPLPPYSWDTLLLPLLQPLLPEQRAVFSLLSRLHSSPLLISLSFPSPQTPIDDSTGCLYECHLLSWHLKARFVFGSKVLG